MSLEHGIVIRILFQADESICLNNPCRKFSRVEYSPIRKYAPFGRSYYIVKYESCIYD